MATLSVFGVAAYLADFSSARLIDIGKKSFAIYLLHMPIAGIVSNLCNRLDIFVVTVARPIIVLAIVYIVLYLADKLIPEGSIKKCINMLIGMR